MRTRQRKRYAAALANNGKFTLVSYSNSMAKQQLGCLRRIVWERVKLTGLRANVSAAMQILLQHPVIAHAPVQMQLMLVQTGGMHPGQVKVRSNNNILTRDEDPVALFSQYRPAVAASQGLLAELYYYPPMYSLYQSRAVITTSRSTSPFLRSSPRSSQLPASPALRERFLYAGLDMQCRISAWRGKFRLPDADELAAYCIICINSRVLLAYRALSPLLAQYWSCYIRAHVPFRLRRLKQLQKTHPPAGNAPADVHGRTI